MNPQKHIYEFEGGNYHMKRSLSDLAMELQALLNDDHHNIATSAAVIKSTGVHGFLGNYHDHAEFNDPTAGVDCTDLPFALGNQYFINGLLSSGGFDQNPSWYQNIKPQHPCVSAIESQSFICAGSPTSTLKRKTRDNQGSGSSEDDDIETEAGQCEQSEDGINVKRLRRMVSNRESAQRSRSRKQAHVTDLEKQVEQLGGEHVTLYRQLAEAMLYFKDASTNNRVLKSDLEALRAKVKLAEDMVTRGWFSCSLNHLFKTQLNSSHQMLNNLNISQIANNVSATIMVQGQGTSLETVFSGQNSGIDSLNCVLPGNVVKEWISEQQS